jgi:hypothetical protein
MNRVLIYGGLGNQMFQYAFCKALNLRGHESKILFTNFFYHRHHNGFDLCSAFKLKLDFPSKLYKALLDNGQMLYNNKKSKYLLEEIITRYHKKKYKLYQEKEEFFFDENVFHQTSSFMVGTWQSEKYFADIKEFIKEDFIFIPPKDKKNKELSKEILDCNSVSIHVRRGDYLDPRWAASHQVINDKTYYSNAINYVNNKIKNPRFYIFSDDISWVVQNLSVPNSVIISHNKGKNSYFDMYLMSLCKHNIISNSTFSWWGAWLNNNETKIVTIPYRWLNTKDCKELYPANWIKINT